MEVPDREERSVPVVGIRELARQVSRLVGEVEASREPAVITRHGRAVAMIVPVDAAALEDFLLSNAPEFVEGIREADRELAAGETRPLSAVLADLEHEDAAADTSRAAGQHR
jgi:antitoxin (DNA-binding transcriptional repressor) of toxin-antitoxin stability system